jgi:hypothetical protein
VEYPHCETENPAVLIVEPGLCVQSALQELIPLGCWRVWCSKLLRACLVHRLPEESVPYRTPFGQNTRRKCRRNTGTMFIPNAR